MRVGPLRKLSAKVWMLLNCSVGEDSFKCPLDCKKIKPVNPKGNQSWIFTGRADAEAEAPVLWPPDAKCWLIGKDPGSGNDWRQRRRRQRWLHGITDSMDMSLIKFGRLWRTGKLGVLQSMELQKVGHDWVSEQQHGTQYKKINIPIQKRVEDLKWQLSEEYKQMTITHMQRCSTSVIIREIQMKTAMNYHLTPLGMVIIKKKSVMNNCLRGSGEKEILFHCWLEYKLIQIPYRVAWRFLKN